jgi:lysine-specific demethylase 3
VCIDCYKERKEGIVSWKMTKSDREERDKYYWLKCTNDSDQHALILCKMIPGNALSDLNEKLHKFCDDNKITLFCSCRDTTISAVKPSDKLQFQRALMRTRRKKQRIHIIRNRSVLNFDENLKQVKHTYVSSENVLRFESPSESAESYGLFQCEWERAKPIVVADVKKKLKSEIWSPEYFLKNFGSVKHSLVNCQSDTVIKRVPMKDFWHGFKSYESRLPHNSPNKLILKLKDWPDTQDFADLLHEHYSDIMQAIPFSTYTRRDGIYNLARYQHPHFLKPDLGPKLYCAYGNFDETTSLTKGSTNLHLDISDAVNILVHVSRPEDYQLAKKQYDKEEIRKALEAAGCDEADLQIFMASERLPGAIWHIFHSTDVSKLQNALHEYAKANSIPLKPHEDPIHNQDWYVDVKLKRALEEKGISFYTIIQYEGDCIFVPAKTPHQVTNIFDCIKIALDFVTPENVSECFNLTNEFRLLSTRHANREDKLQIKSILYHTIKNLVYSKDST